MRNLNTSYRVQPNRRFYLLCQYETRLPSVILRLHGEVDPMAASLVALYEELIIIALRAVRDIQQDRGIADGLFKSRHTDIHSAARQVVARRRSSDQPVHLCRTVARVDHQREHLSGTVPRIECIIRLVSC